MSVISLQIRSQNQINLSKAKLTSFSGYLHIFEICDSKSWHIGTVNMNELSSIDEVVRETCLKEKKTKLDIKFTV